MNKIKAASIGGAIALSLAASGLAGCGGADGSATAITVNGEDLSMGAATLWLRYQQAETYSTMIGYGLSAEGLWDTNYSASSEEGMTYGKVMKDSYTGDLEGYLVLRQHASDYGVTIPEDLQEKINAAAAASVAANKDAFKKMGVTEDHVREILELATYRTLMYEPMVEDTDRVVSDEEAAQSSVTYTRIYRYVADEDGNTSEADEGQLETWREELRAMLAAIEETGDPATADMYNIAKDINEDAYTYSFSYGADDTAIEDAVKEAVLDLEDGELYPEIIETDNYLTIVRLDAAFDADKTETEKQSIIESREQENFSTKLEDWLAESEISASEAWEQVTISDAEVYQATYNAAESAAGEE